MPFCSKCGAQVADQAAFCAQCGSPQSKTATASPSAAAQPGMAENTAGTLCYLLGWITGLIFFFIDKRPFVRFHAAQSIVVFGGLHIITHVLGFIIGVRFLTGGWRSFGAGVLVLHALHILTLVLWILLMVKAYQGERFKIPIAYEIAEGFAGKS